MSTVQPCDAAIDSIHAELDGALDASGAEALQAHLRDCASCRTLREEMAALVTSASELPREMAPSTDLWGGIRARLEEGEARKAREAKVVWWNPRRAAGLAGVMALAAAVLVGLSIGWPPPEQQVLPLDAEAAAWEAGIRDATADLEKALAAQQEGLDPETLEVVTRNLRIIDQAIEETRAVLAKKPQDAAGRASLAALHQHKLQLLRQAVDLSREG